MQRVGAGGPAKPLETKRRLPSRPAPPELRKAGYMTEIRWEDPPPRKVGGPRDVWIDRLEPLVAHPKRWAIVHISPSKGAASRLQQALTRHELRMPPGRYEFTARAVDGEHRMYARYLGPDEDSAP